MANKIKIKRGLKTNLPTLEVGEMGYCTDTNELFIGTSTGNELINEDSSIATLGDIGDVEFTDLETGQGIVYDGEKWINGFTFKPLEFGVQWNQPTDTVTRLGNAIGLTAGSDFTSLGDNGVWKLRRCMINDDLSINYYIDPSDPTKIGEVVNTVSYTTGDNADYTGGDGQVMVEIPKFYWKTLEPSSNVYQWWVSPKKADGSYEVHPAFITSGQTRDFIYMAAFEGTSTSFTSVLQSISGLQPRTENHIISFRNRAQARGTGWQIQTYWGTHALQILYLVEYADFDSQSTIGRGYVDAPNSPDNESITTGRTIFLGNESGREAGTDGLTAISYRGVENFWGNVFKWVDGINAVSPYFFDAEVGGFVWGEVNVYTANEGFESNKTTSPYTLQGTLAKGQYEGSNVFVSNILFPHFLATEGNGSSTSHLHDNYAVWSYDVVAQFGGSFAFGSQSGAFQWFLLANEENDMGLLEEYTASRLQIL